MPKCGVLFAVRFLTLYQCVCT